jgi:general secretion pathway protein A
MYEDFYKLREKPFDLNPSPRFLYLSDTHKEALALLTYAVMERKGFILLTGEVGTGKTTIVQTLLAGLDRNIQYILISNPRMSVPDFLDYIAFNIFHKKIHFKSKSDFLIEFEEYLKRCRQHQKTFVLIIDESQTLSYEMLEEIRLLSNLESADEKLINIFLIGQPELNERLSEPRCRPVLQRINNRYHLKPLDLNSTITYIATRLRVAGIEKFEDIFPSKTIKALYEYSGGYPRMINVLADNTLLLGYSREKKKISPAMVKECYEDMNINLHENEKKKQPKGQEIPVHEQSAPAPSRRYLRSGFLILLLVLVILVGLSLVQNELSYQGQIKLPDNIIRLPFALLSDKKGPDPEQNQSGPVEKNTTDRIQQKITVPSEPIPENIHTNEIKNQNNDAADETNKQNKDTIEKQPDKPLSPPEAEEEKTSKLVMVKPGDTLTKLSIEIYGRNDNAILDMIRQHNPGLNNINLISVGQKILFPPLSSDKREALFTVQIGTYKDFKLAQDQFQKMIQIGNETFILPITGKEQAFRVTLGSFQSRPEAERFALDILNKEIAKSVEVVRINFY